MNTQNLKLICIRRISGIPQSAMAAILLAVILLAWFAAIPVMAAPNDPCKGKPADRPPECDGDNSEISSCRDVFEYLANDDICSCTFTLDDSTTQQGTPPLLLWRLRSDCVTHETLVIPQFEGIWSPGDGYTLTAEDPFTGSSVIAAAGHRAQATDLKIDIGPGVVAGCGDFGGHAGPTPPVRR